jgi:hypothetical protein
MRPALPDRQHPDRGTVYPFGGACNRYDNLRRNSTSMWPIWIWCACANN